MLMKSRETKPEAEEERRGEEQRNFWRRNKPTKPGLIACDQITKRAWEFSAFAVCSGKSLLFSSSFFLDSGRRESKHSRMKSWALIGIFNPGIPTKNELTAVTGSVCCLLLLLGSSTVDTKLDFKVGIVPGRIARGFT